MMDSFIAQAANEFADHYIEGEKKRWARGDACVLVEYQPQGLLHLKEQLEQQHGIVVTPQTLRNYAQVAKSFAEEHRHYQYKWSNYLEWAKWENPIEAMEMALDNCYSPSQMRNLRLHGDTEYKKREKCKECGGDLLHCKHKVQDDGRVEVWYHVDKSLCECKDCLGAGGPGRAWGEEEKTHTIGYP